MEQNDPFLRLYYGLLIVYDESVRKPGDTLEFILFSRSNCPLCEAMEDELRPFIKEYAITVKRHYIDNDPELEQRYGSKVPVLTLEDKTLCEYYLNPESLLSAISQC